METACTALGLSNDEQYLAIGTRKGTIKLYEVKYLLEDIYVTK